MSLAGTQLASNTRSYDVPEIMLVDNKLYEVFNKARGVIRDTCISLVNSGGKRVRPLLTITSALCFGPVNSDTINAAVAAELIHMASLVHDDVIDESSIRRGKPSVNSLQGNSAAVLTGDYIFAEAFNILSSHSLLPSMGYLVEAIKQMCDGEVNQATEQFVTSINTDRYFCRIAKKTGILLAACCKSGAATAGASEEEIFHLGEYGLNLGYAFQIVDDILDFTGSPEKLGKPIGVDVTSGNITLPVIMLMDNPVYGGWITEVLKTKNITTSGVESIKQALLNAGSIEKSLGAARDCVAKAKASLDKIPAGKYKDTLYKLADMVLERET